MKKLIMLLLFMFLNFGQNVKADVPPCLRTYETSMGKICVQDLDKKWIIYSYMGVYLDFLEKNFDTTKVKFSGRKYSDKRLYSIYRYIIHKDGSISDITPVVVMNDEFDAHVRNFILEFSPAPLIDGMDDQIKVELEVLQTYGEYGGGMPGNIWGDYFQIHFLKGVY